MKYFNSIFIIIVCINLYSCKSKSPEEATQEILKGEWAIDDFVYKQKEISDCFLLNLISFYDDSITGLPTSYNICESINEKEFKGIKNVVYKNKNDIKVLFKTRNAFFQDTFKLRFIGDNKNRILYLNLESKETYIYCSKLYYDYSNLASFIDIIRIDWKE